MNTNVDNVYGVFTITRTYEIFPIHNGQGIKSKTHVEPQLLNGENSRSNKKLGKNQKQKNQKMDKPLDEKMLKILKKYFSKETDSIKKVGTNTQPVTYAHQDNKISPLLKNRNHCSNSNIFKVFFKY